MMEDNPRRSQLTMVLYSVSGKSEEVDGTMVLFMVVWICFILYVVSGMASLVINDIKGFLFISWCSEGARIWFQFQTVCQNDFRMVCECV